MSGIPATLTGTAAAPVAAAGAGGGPALMAMMTNPLTAAIAIPAIMAMLKS